ncbi:hypothetical protein P8C59_006931 [Phyllachora maydis]|uniref:ACB domain-containing protein n=1 Tax=Phyllachora maydis TaxID=1825666 RepID=A0AAD9MF09_9PEZI|nr:hypothetical protein P8C59_006931 [Phyllachora maydis]
MKSGTVYGCVRELCGSILSPDRRDPLFRFLAHILHTCTFLPQTFLEVDVNALQSWDPTDGLFAFLDSVDRVFVHALNTVKRVPKTGATRPPPADRLRLYGLYKQAMEGDVDGVMARPTAAGADMSPEELAREQDKWDAWHLQKGISRTEAKRRYVETLIETMHKYATTPNAMALVGELEFVWNQVKNNATSSSGSSPGSGARQFLQPLSGTEGPMKVLSPMSEEDASERRMIAEEEAEDHVPDDGESRLGGNGDCAKSEVPEPG